MYPGINGRTHGDKKLINPAKKAIDNVVFIKLIMWFYRQVYFHLEISKYTYSSILWLSIF